MIAADGVEEAPRIGAGVAPAGRHAAWGVVTEPRTAGRRPAVLLVAPAVCTAVLAGIAVALVVHGAQSAGYHIRGGTMTAVWVLSALILAVVLGTLALAGRVAAGAGAPRPAHAAPDPMLFAPPQGQPGSQTQPGMQAPPTPTPTPPPATPPQVAASAAEAAAVMAAVNAPNPPAVPAGVPDTGVDLQVIFAQLVRRLLTLVLQQINRLDELENEVEDPKLLKALFGIDHQATQVRRYGENIGVLVGAMPQRQWTQPVPVTVAQRSAVSETPDYPRVQVIPRAPGRIHGHAVSDVIHILSELVENATNYSNPNTKVTVSAHRVAAGLAVEVNDHGIGMEPEQIQRLNTLLRDPSGANVRDLLSQGRIGLSVVAKMAQRHGIAVELQPNVTGGTMALIVLPDALLAPEEAPAGERRQQRRAVDTSRLPARPALAPITAPMAAAAERTGSGSASALAPVAAPARAGSQGRNTPPAPARHPAYSVQPAPAEVPPPLPRHEEPEREPEPEPAPALLPDGRPQLRRRTPQSHISARLFQADSSQPPEQQQPGPGALSPTMMSDFWQGLSAASGTPEPEPSPAPRTEGFAQSPGWPAPAPAPAPAPSHNPRAGVGVSPSVSPSPSPAAAPPARDPDRSPTSEARTLWSPAPSHSSGAALTFPSPSAPAPAAPTSASPPPSDLPQRHQPPRTPDPTQQDRPTVNRQEWNQ